MALSTEDAAALVSLRVAYRSLIAGEKVAKVTAFGRTVEYAQGDTRRLKAEIDRLEALDSDGGRKRGAFRFLVR
ncbi:MAG: hypothetical protein KF842_06825 [Caulobacter sp.]|nr:hypothetical protein [Caulobacter sp.]